MLEKVRDLPITGFSASATELINIPTPNPIRELRFDIIITDANGGTTVTGDPFNIAFTSIELIYDGDRQYIIENMADLQAISLMHTGRKAQVHVIDDSNASASEQIIMKFRLPVGWKSPSDALNPQLRIVWGSTALTGTLTEVRIVYSDDIANMETFKYVKVPQTSTSGGTLQFKPSAGSVVRGAFILNLDASATHTSGGRYSLASLGGANGIAQVNLTHKGVDYWLNATERDLLHHFFEVFDRIPMMGVYDDLAVESYEWAQLPFTYNYVTGDLGGDTIPADATGYAGLNPFLYVSFEDIQADVNTLLQVVSDTGTYNTGDQVTVTFVYKKQPASDVAK